MFKKIWKWIISDSQNSCIIGYRVQIYQEDKDIWTFKTTGLYSYQDAYNEAKKIRNETGKKTRVLEYWEIKKIVNQFS